MTTTSSLETPSVARRSRTTTVGWVLTGLMTAFFLFDAIPKLLSLSFVVEPSMAFGFSRSDVPVIGATLLVCVVLHLIPRTNILGAVLLTGYLGGATATQLRADLGVFSLIFPVICGVLVWAGLWLRDPSVRAVMPVRR